MTSFCISFYEVFTDDRIYAQATVDVLHALTYNE